MATQVGIDYLSAAKEAVSYTVAKIKLGPANKLSVQDGIGSQLRAMGGLLKVREGVDKDLQDKFVNETDAFRHVQIYAQRAEQYGGGNCEEHSAVAYMRLRRQHVYPLDWCRWRSGDHAFVIIGRPAGKWDPGAMPQASWFPDAVICDPWARKSGYWRDLWNEYPPVNIVPMLHQESQEQIPVWKNL
ncbi:MAG: hypothetical protein HY235_12285 [Acidobacteria bacterium]|nr:hypothetical protein [Acidobacteriota bacterium]